jgi:hypothetical protein
LSALALLSTASVADSAILAIRVEIRGFVMGQVCLMRESAQFAAGKFTS